MIQQVWDRVYIGDWQDAGALLQARQNGDAKVKDFVIVSVACDTPFAMRGDYPLHMVDGPDEGNAMQLWRARNQVAKSLAEGKQVFVHCAVGASRSPSVVIAYLMNEHGMSYDEALMKVRQGRPIANPHPALAQLIQESGRFDG